MSVSISGIEKPLTVPAHLVAQFSLRAGVVLTAAQLERLIAESDLWNCDRTAARLLAAREHSIGEIRVKLRARRFPDNVVKETIRKYCRQGVLDDAVFAYHQAEKLVNRRPCGKSFLTAFLQRKRIDRQLAQQTTEQVLEGKDEQQLAAAALVKRWRESRQFELEVAQRKAYNYLARRGFGYEAAKAAFEQIQRQQEEETED